ncbi:MAG: UPF0261 family protein, partial [Actinobacteria bacterium]|nr:UPF0261 family protein [Actinomycetota bacterium]
MLIKGLSKTALLVGTLDTKGEEYLFAKNRFNQAGIKTIIIDAGILGSPKLTPDYSNEVVAHAGGVELKELISKANRGSAVSAMTKGVLKTVQELFSKGE